MQFKATFFALASLVAFVAAIPAADDAKRCTEVCCDAFVQGAYPTPNKVGINCSRGGIDCGFSGQVQGCCQLVPISTNPIKTGINCE